MAQPEKQSSEYGWSHPVDRLQIPAMPPAALNVNVQGKPLTGPFHGFGRLWQKTFRIRLAGVAVTPQQVIAIWKERFERFWPDGNKSSMAQLMASNRERSLC